MLSNVLIAILIILLIGGAAYAIVQYAPFIPQPLKLYVLYAIGAIVLVAVVLQLIPLLTAVSAPTVVSSP